MQAIRIEQFGKPSVLKHLDVSTPQPGPDDVLIEVKAAGINPSDVKNVQGLFPNTTLPRIPGRDFAGVVLEGPDDLRGREVWGSGGDLGFTRDGAHAALVVVPREAVGPKPTNMSFEDAAGVGVPYITAATALIDAAAMSAEDTILIIGAAGSVGISAVQIARCKGCRVLGLIRDESQRAQIEQYGAEALVSRDSQELADLVKAATDGKGATLILDTVGGSLFEPSLRSLANRGRQVVITTAEKQVSFDLLDFYRRELRLIGVNTLSLDGVAGVRILESLRPGFESAALHAPPIAARFPLTEATRAYEQVASGAAKGKVVIVPS
jgi:NADPH:quinone reductase-like Zn-dependent oxidoreductase